MRILCIGDVFGKPGRQAVHQLLPALRKELSIDWIIANAENASGGLGLTIDSAKDLFAASVDVLTSGNHIWRYKELIPFLESENHILRPLNYPEGNPGRGYAIYPTASGAIIGVINLQGRIFMDPISCPFTTLDLVLTEIQKQTPIIIVDFHAEATSEKRAMGWYLNGRVSAVYGTHTHVQTADEEILSSGTGYITDIGMTGPFHSVIGMDKQSALQRFLTGRPSSFQVAEEDLRLCGVLLDIDPETGRTQSIERICKTIR